MNSVLSQRGSDIVGNSKGLNNKRPERVSLERPAFFQKGHMESRFFGFFSTTTAAVWNTFTGILATGLVCRVAPKQGFFLKEHLDVDSLVFFCIREAEFGCSSLQRPKIHDKYGRNTGCMKKPRASSSISLVFFGGGGGSNRTSEQSRNQLILF